MTSNKIEKIFYTGNFNFPDGDAGARRIYGIGKALTSFGYEVTVLGAERSGRPQDAITGDGFRYRGLSYYPSGEDGNSVIRRGLRLWRTYIYGISSISRLKALWTEESVAVIAYQASSPLLYLLRRFCEQHSAVLVADAVEWYDRRHVAWGRYGPFALDSELRMRYMHGQTDGIISISRYLEGYYRREGIPTIRVPALVDIQDDFGERGCINQRDGAPLQLAFVGKAGKKDLLVNAIRGLARLGDEARNWELVMVGPTRDEVMNSLGDDARVLDRLNSSLRFVGAVSHTDALAYLSRADYSIILRPDHRFAHAGFPTKLVESLSMGIPVICNLTGDIGMYVNDGQEGIIVPDCSPEAFASGLRRAIALTVAQRMTMRGCARRRAEVSFDYRNWTEPLGEFMRQVIETKSLTNMKAMIR